MAIIGSGVPHDSFELMQPFPIIQLSSGNNELSREYKWKAPRATVLANVPYKGNPCIDNEDLKCTSSRIELITPIECFVFATYEQISGTISFTNGSAGDEEDEDETTADTETDAEGDEYILSRPVMIKKKLVNNWDAGERLLFDQITNKTNSSTFESGGAGTWKCLGTAAIKIDDNLHDRRTFFVYKSGGWNTTRFPGTNQFDSLLNRGG